MVKLKIKNKVLEIIYSIILFVMPFMHVNYGLDFTDTGYSIMLFKNVITTQSAGYQQLSTFLSNFLGAFLMALPGGNTYLGIKMYCTTILSILVLFLFIFLKKSFSIHLVFVGLAFAVMSRWCPVVVLYNTMTYLFMYLGIFFLLRSIEKHRFKYLFLAGVILGSSIFVRFPNITQMIFIFPMMFYWILSNNTHKQIVKNFFLCVAGYLCGVITCFFLVCVYQGPRQYIKMVKGLMAVSENEKDYSKFGMLTSTILDMNYDKKWLLMIGIIILIAILTDKFLLSSLKKVKGSIIVQIGICGVFVVVVAYILRIMHYWGIFITSDYTSHLSLFIFIEIIYLVTLFFSFFVVLFGRKMGYEILERTFAFFSICCIIIIPLGTNTGLQAFMNNLYFVLPVSLGLISKKVKFGANACWTIGAIALVVSGIQGGLYYSNYVYGDVGAFDGIKLVMNGDTKLKGEKLLIGMDQIVEEIIEYGTINKWEGKTCVSYGNIPIMPFLLNMESATSNPWPDIRSYLPENFDEDLSKAYKPIIILNKWFTGGDIFDEEILKTSPKAMILAQYIIDNNYTNTFSNDKFLVFEVEE